MHAKDPRTVVELGGAGQMCPPDRAGKQIIHNMGVTRFIMVIIIIIITLGSKRVLHQCWVRNTLLLTKHFFLVGAILKTERAFIL